MIAYDYLYIFLTLLQYKLNIKSLKMLFYVDTEGNKTSDNNKGETKQNAKDSFLG